MLKIRLLGLFFYFSMNVAAGVPSGLETTAKDSSASLKFNLRIQSLFTAQKSLADDADWNTNFVNRRARLKFQGFAFDPKFTYKVELGLTNSDIGALKEIEEANGSPKYILDAVIKYEVNKNFSIWVGQTKLPGNRERLISSQNLQFVDRSLVNSNFNLDRDQGIQFHTNFKLGKAVFRPIFSISKGEGRNITINNVNGFDYTGKVEILPFGKFTKKGDYFGSDIKREEKPKLSVAFTYDYNDGASRDKVQGGSFLSDSNGVYLNNVMNTYFVDLMFKHQGFSIMAEYANRSSEQQLIADNGKKYVTGSGYVAQMGYLLKNNFEVALRYSSLEKDDDNFSALKNTEEYTLGLSRYIDAHRLKIQSDVSMIDIDGNSDNDLRFRFQMELGI